MGDRPHFQKAQFHPSPHPPTHPHAGHQDGALPPRGMNSMAYGGEGISLILRSADVQKTYVLGLASANVQKRCLGLFGSREAIKPQPAIQAASSLASQPTSQAVSQPASHQAIKAASQPASQPVRQQAAIQPAARQVSGPANLRASRPATQPISQPASQLASKQDGKPVGQQANTPPD